LLKKDGLWGRLSASPPSASDAKAYREHITSCEKVSRLVYLSVSPQLRDIKAHKDSAKAMLDALESRFGSSVFASRHNGISSLVTMSMSSDETASALMAWVRDAQNVLIAAMPAKDYSLATLVEELGIYTMLRGTPYSALAPCSLRTLCPLARLRMQLKMKSCVRALPDRCCICSCE